MTDQADDELKDHLWVRRQNVLYIAELSALYHQKRERFFELWDKLGKVASLLGGSAALYKVSQQQTVTQVALLITVTSALSLVFGFSERSKKHAELSRNFKQLIGAIAAKGVFDFTESDVNAWEAERYQLETSEPPALSMLVVMCQNEIAVAKDQKDKVVPVGFFKRQLANFIDIPAPHT